MPHQDEHYLKEPKKDVYRNNVEVNTFSETTYILKNTQRRKVMKFVQ